MSDRVVSVRYRVTVYADVDLDTGEIVRVIENDESIRLDSDQRLISFELMPLQSAEVAAEVVEAAFGPDAGPYPVDITPEIAREAVELAESLVWPAWERS